MCSIKIEPALDVLDKLAIAEEIKESYDKLSNAVFASFKANGLGYDQIKVLKRLFICLMHVVIEGLKNLEYNGTKNPRPYEEFESKYNLPAFVRKEGKYESYKIDNKPAGIFKVLKRYRNATFHCLGSRYSEKVLAMEELLMQNDTDYLNDMFSDLRESMQYYKDAIIELHNKKASGPLGLLKNNKLLETYLKYLS